jgi:hypothetical protein
MSLKAGSIGVLGATLAAIGTMALAATSASAAPLNCEEAKTEAPLCLNFVEFEAGGTLFDKKLNQEIPLNEARFNGYLELLSISPVEGNVHGLVTSKPIETSVKVLGTTAKVGVQFEQVGVTNGKLTQIASAGSPNCEQNPAEPCVTLSVPTEANIKFSSITIFGIKFSISCETSKPIQFPLSENLQLFGELLDYEVGSHFVGTTEFPSVKCGNELFKFINEPLLTDDFSGPGNSYSLYIRE